MKTTSEHIGFLKAMDAMDKAIVDAVACVKDGHDADQFLGYLIASLDKGGEHRVVGLMAMQLQDLWDDLREGKQ